MNVSEHQAEDGDIRIYSYYRHVGVGLIKVCIFWRWVGPELYHCKQVYSSSGNPCTVALTA